MKVLLSWLREFAPEISGTPDEIGEQLSALGLAVEDTEIIGGGLDGIVVARVEALNEHPNADKIQLVQVDAGDGEPLQVCCGAFNMSVGDLIPFATIGTVMPNGMEIGRRKMRGEWSNGMCCSGDEIGMSTDADGIMILDGDLALGTPITEALGIEADVLWDLEVNPNRPDAMSIMGVARDLAAAQGVAFAIPEPDVTEAGPDASTLVSVDVQDPVLCGRFCARVLTGVTVGESDPKIARRLTQLGMRPINSIVDASNYVMLELGQPNHTFDLDTVPNGKLIVRRATDGEKILTLDDAERTLDAGEGVITNESGEPVSIAGIMGGASTEISDTTTQVLLEMAWWDPPTIARGSRRLGLRSEASARFERGTDPEIAPVAMRRFAELIGATLCPGMVDVRGELPSPELVLLRTARTNAMLGTDLSPADIRGHLESIGFGVTPQDDDQVVTIPSWRPDSATEIDLIEEVARMHGYVNIARTVPHSVRAGALTDRQRARRAIRQVMLGAGLTEAMPLPFLSPADVTAAQIGVDGIEVVNPLRADESIMRPSLMPGLIKAVAFNESHQATGVELFEVGHVYRPHADASAELPDERDHLAAVLAGSEAPAAVELWNSIVDALNLDGAWIRNDAVAGLHPQRSALVGVGDTTIGSVGEISPDVLDAFEVTERVGYLELDLTALFAIDHGDVSYRRVSRYPIAVIDLAFLVPETVSAADVSLTLRSAAGELLLDAELFDVYRDPERLGADTRSLAYTLRFQAPDRTLSDDEITAVWQAAADAVVSTHGAELRSAS